MITNMMKLQHGLDALSRRVRKLEEAQQSSQPIAQPLPEPVAPPSPSVVGLRQARAVFRAAFEDKSKGAVRSVYVDNIAMVLHDTGAVTDHALRNEAAEAIVRHVFESAGDDWGEFSHTRPDPAPPELVDAVVEAAEAAVEHSFVHGFDKGFTGLLLDLFSALNAHKAGGESGERLQPGEAKRVLAACRAVLDAHKARLETEPRRDYDDLCDELAAWKSASGLTVGGDPDGVTPDALSAEMGGLSVFVDDIARIVGVDATGESRDLLAIRQAVERMAEPRSEVTGFTDGELEDLAHHMEMNYEGSDTPPFPTRSETRLDLARRIRACKGRQGKTGWVLIPDDESDEGNPEVYETKHGACSATGHSETMAVRRVTIHED